METLLQRDQPWVLLLLQVLDSVDVQLLQLEAQQLVQLEAQELLQVRLEQTHAGLPLHWLATGFLRDYQLRLHLHYLSLHQSELKAQVVQYKRLLYRRQHLHRRADQVLQLE